MTAPQDPFSTPPPGGTPPVPPPAPGYGAPSEPVGYGTPAAPAYGQQPFGAPGGFGGGVSPRNGFGIAALVLGILSIPAGFTVIFGVPLAIAAIVFGALGRGRAKKGLANNGGLALTGLILGVVGLLISIAIGALAGSLLSRGDFGNLTDCLESAGNDKVAQNECSVEFEDSITG